MTELEDRIRTATQARAEEITQASLPPLRLSPSALRLGRMGPGCPERQWQRWLIPLTAAAAVAAIVAGMAVLARGPAARPAPHPATHRHAPRDAARAIPRYYVALEGTRRPYRRNPADAAVYSSVTGARLASVVPPAPFVTFVDVAAAADDRTFVLAAKLGGHFTGGPGVGFFVLHFSPRDNSARLTQVSGSGELTGERINAFALSPDGRKLAIADWMTTRGSHISQEIGILSLRTGAEKGWYTDDGVIPRDTADPLVLSWTADSRTLAFNWVGSGPGDGSTPTARERAETGLRLLSLSAPGVNLITASRLALPVSGQNRATPAGSESDVAVITPDGQTVLAAVSGPVHQPGTPAAWYDTGFAEFSAATGATQRVRDWRRTASTEQGGPTDVLWSSRSGRALVVYSPAGHWGRIGVLRGDHLTLLPQPPKAQLPNAAW